MKTTRETEAKAHRLTMFLYGKIPFICKFRIEEEEAVAKEYIKRLEKKYNVIA